MKLTIEKNIPFPKNSNKELVNALLELEDGDSVFLSYDVYNKTTVSNCLANARMRIAAKGLSIKTIGTKEGRRIWAFKK